MKSGKGFTLAELLVVVAIIAILVAVSIPIFTGRLNEAKKNTDLANERAAKAAAITDYLQSDSDKTNYWKYYDAESGAIVGDFFYVKGYNQIEQSDINGNPIAPKRGVIQIFINNDDDTNGPKVKIAWCTVKN